MAKDYFEILGVERRFRLDGAELERRFHEESKLHHPDRHAQAAAEAKVKSALASSLLNQGYRTLKDPIKRAEYLLELEGIRLSDERAGHKVKPEFLGEILELREELMEAREAGDRGRVEKLNIDVKSRHEKALADADAGFLRFEKRSDKNDRDGLVAAADAMVAERYYRRFLDEADAFLDPVE